MTLDILTWTEEYLKYKNTIHRKISKIDKKLQKQELTCHQKDGTIQKYLCLNELEKLKIKDLENNRVSCLNTKQNLDWLIKNWDEIKNMNTTFFFANPSQSMHWSINPKLHDNITEKNNLKQGLKSLFNSIPKI